MDPDDLDDLLGEGQRAEMEARFRELEREAEIERLHQQTGAPRAQRPGAQQPGAHAEPSSPPADDPLAEMKAALDDNKALERYLLVLCPGCGTKNRMSLTRVRTASPICGRCKQDLSFTRV